MEEDKQKRVRVHPKHWDILLNYLEVHPELVTGKFNCSNAKQRSNELWHEVANVLNSIGLGVKTADKWKIALQDWKYKTKSKIAGLKSYQCKTGGGPSSTIVLNEQEERLMGIEGWNLNVPESGISLSTQSETEVIQVLEEKPPEEHHSVEFEPLQVYQIIENVPVKSKKVKDHKTKRPKDIEQLDRYQEETMSVLKDISNSVGGISDNLRDISNSIKDMVDILKVIPKDLK